MKRSFILALALLALTGCISREQADMRLQRGCAAGAELFLGDGYKITEVKDHIFRDSPDLGAGYREARLTVSVNDGFSDADREIRCIFSETFNGYSHAASIYQLKIDDKTWGKQGDEILGTMDEHMKLNEAVDKALMNQ